MLEDLIYFMLSSVWSKKDELLALNTLGAANNFFVML
jgi:hypothetical protein